jgi:putative endopeptidase
VAELVVRQPDYLMAFAALWSGAELADWKDWARWRLIHARAALLTEALVEEDFDFYGRTLVAEQIRERWKRAVSLVEGDGRSGRPAVRRAALPADAKARMDAWSPTCARPSASASTTWTG